jgi:hypothetical protein
MAIPTSPSVVVLENDVSIYTPNINSSVVGLVGFANKGPLNVTKVPSMRLLLLRAKKTLSDFLVSLTPPCKAKVLKVLLRF